MSLASQKAVKEKKSNLHVLYGFAQLVSMADPILKGLFKDEDTLSEIEALREIFRQNNIDISAMKKGLGLILSFRLKEKYNHPAEEEGDSSMPEYLCFLLEEEYEVMRDFVTGCSQADIERLKEEMTMPCKAAGGSSSGPDDLEQDGHDPTLTSEVTASQIPKISFDDIIGAEKAKDMLKQFADIMKNPQNHRYGEFISPKGILLYGPPGTGKTMLARAMAAEAGAAFHAVNATDFFGKYLGEGEERIRNLFQKAKEHAPAIIFIDEIDAIAKERTGERNVESYLNALMTEMEGFSCDPARPVFVLAATNFHVGESPAGSRSAIDSALIRRFNDRIRVDLPNKEERIAFLRMMLDKYGIDSVSEDAVESIADRTNAQSLATVKNVLQLALCKADKNDVPLQDDGFLEALDEYRFGERKEWNDADNKSTAYHEAGHAYIAHLAGRTPSFVTIVSRGNYGGYMHTSEENIYSRSRQDLIWEIRTALAGRASETVFTGEEKGINTGACEDLRRASVLAINMVSRYGMSENGLLCLDLADVPGTPYSKNVLEKAEKILEEEMKVTKELIEEGRNRIERLSQALLDKSQLMKEQIKEYLEDDGVNLIDETSSAITV